MAQRILWQRNGVRVMHGRQGFYIVLATMRLGPSARDGDVAVLRLRRGATLAEAKEAAERLAGPSDRKEP
jgi:hypothetical protein